MSVPPAPPPFTDIPSTDRIARLLPAPLVPYARLARLDRPIGWWLLLLPCWWSLALAGYGRPDARLFALFWLGAVVMRGAGCTLNDILDRDIDARVERTRGRPIPSGQVSVRQAILFLVVQLVVGAAILFSLNGLAIMLGCAVLVLVGTYPLMKRVTHWPQLFLGLNFNWGALLAWAAATGRIEAPALFLYAGGVAWTLGYDTIYAHQDKADDALIGVKSTALRFAARSRRWIAFFYALAVAAWGAALALSHAATLAYAALAAIAAHFSWQVAFWRMDEPADCLRRFRSNRSAGLLMLASCILAAWGR